MRKKLLRLMRIAPLALVVFASTAYAQTTGSIIGVVTDASSGKPVAGAVVIATSPNLQGEQTAVTASDGNFQFVLLPAGTYKLMVQLAGYKPGERADIRLSADKTLRANLQVIPEAVTLEEQLVRTGLTPVVNVGNAESGSVVSKEFVANIPTGRTFQALATLVPQAANDTYGVGFQGAESPENGYIVDGLNVTDPVYGSAAGTWQGRSAPTLMSNFIQEVDVKTGAFMPEYGRATGGIINVVTRSGSNEYHGSVFSNYRPDFLVQPDSPNLGINGQALGLIRKPSEGTYGLDFGAEIGGPIMKDKLWFYAGFAPIIQKTYYDRYQRINVLESDAVTGCPSGSQPDPLDPLGRCYSGGKALFNKVPGSDIIKSGGQTSYQWVGKLSYLLNENNTFAVSTYGQPSVQKAYVFSQPQSSDPIFSTNLDSYEVVGKYSGKFLDKRLIVEAVGGWHGQRIKDDPTGYQRTTPRLNWSDTFIPASSFALTAFESVPGCIDVAHCPVSNYATGGYSIILDQTIDRYAGRLSATGLLNAAGAHTAKVGIDLERNDYDNGKYYSGGFNLRSRNGQIRTQRGYAYLADAAGNTLDSTANAAEYHPTGRLTTRSYNDSFSYFVQDSWSILATGVTINAGIRLETQNMVNRDNSSNKLDVTDSWAPRVQAIWDFTGNGRGKAAASWGRFYWSIPLDMADRSFGNEQEVQFRQRWASGGVANPCFASLAPFAGAAARPDPVNNGGAVGVYSAFDPRAAISYSGITGVPCSTAGFMAPLLANGDTFLQTGSTATPVQPGLNATSVDMFGGQVEYEVLADLSVGIEYAGRRQNKVIEDMSPDNGTHYFIANPGSSATWTYQGQTYSAKSVQATDEVSGRLIDINMPKPERSYDGLTFKVTKNFSRRWLAQASYTYSVSRGNYGGPFDPNYGATSAFTQGQLDPGITAAFDLPTRQGNLKGYLPSDSTHTVKLYGAYTYPISTRFSVTGGAGYTGASGTPQNALGSESLYGDGIVYLIPRGQAGRTPFTHKVDVRGQLAYTFRPPYELRVGIDVFNLFNSQKATGYDQRYTLDDVQPINGINCKNSAAGSSNPIQAIQQACPDIAYLKTIDGRPANPNLNFGRAWGAFQVPIQLQLSLALSF